MQRNQKSDGKQQDRVMRIETVEGEFPIIITQREDKKPDKKLK